MYTNMFSPKFSKNTPPDRQAIPLPACVTDNSNKLTQASAKPEKSWLATDRYLPKKSSLDANNKITDYFKGRKINFASRDEVGERRSFSAKRDDDFTIWKKTRSAFSTIENFQRNDASSQRSISTVFGANFKTPTTVSYSKNTSFDSLSDFKDPSALIKKSFARLTFSCLRKNTDDAHAQTTANSSSSSSQDIFSILTPTSQNEEISSRSTTSNSENAFPLQSQSQTCTQINSSEADASQDLFSSSSEGVATAQVSKKSIEASVEPPKKRMRPAVNYEELSDSDFERETPIQSKRKRPAERRPDLAKLNSEKASNLMASQDLFSSSSDCVDTVQASQKTKRKEYKSSVDNTKLPEFDFDEITQRKINAQTKSRVDLAKLSQDLLSSSLENVATAQASQKSTTSTVTSSKNPSVNTVELDLEPIPMTQSKRKCVQLRDFNFDEGPSAEEWQTALKEGIKKIRNEELIMYNRYFDKSGWPPKPDKKALIARIATVLADSQRTGYILYRKTCYSNCVFYENR